MIAFPNCKINFGLHVINKRSDGFHTIETVFYPVNWCDALEVIENKGSKESFTFSHSGLPIDGAPESNLIYKAWKLISTEKKLPPLSVHLHKNIPMGAGLGGGSSDAAAFINLLNTQFELNYSEHDRLNIASQLGSDCAFFIKNSPVLAKGKGNEFSDIQINLSKYYIVLVYPNIHSNTKAAYEGLTPKEPQHSLKDILETYSVNEWKDVLVNDFEVSIFKKYPEIKTLKETLYNCGALYAAMSGSGSSVFAVFEKRPDVSFPAEYSFYLQEPASP
ncbi:MAG: 4-(cytidine 5'-diphospho)-2-C-methyl-D-erythritol kinase [Bacteroidetes bacterium]|nr:4-(cytidine 5'-diphospho)-2-C-methyl-D-erythritol kinase [Bacteroidota bacterium]